MNLYIQQRVFSIGDRYSIFNENEQTVYTVQSELFAFGAKLHLLDTSGQELYYIERKLFRFLPEYHIYKDDTLYAVLKKELSFFEKSIDIDSSFGRFEMQGDLFAMDFTITNNGRYIGELHKKWLSFGDSYELSIADGTDPAFFCTLAIAVDNCIHNENN